MKTWSELTEEEREVVKRIPRTGGYTDEERKANHRWCTRCWYEQAPPDQQQA